MIFPESIPTSYCWIYFHPLIFMGITIMTVPRVDSSGNSLKILPFTFPSESSVIGERATATCASSSGEKMDFKWSRNGKTLTKGGNVDIRSYPDLSNLVIGPLTKEDSGNYTCVVTARGMTASHTAPLEVLVPPSWIHVPHDMDVLSGDAISLDCAGQGIPKVTTTWYKQQGESKEYETAVISNVAVNGSLLLTAVEKSDEGMYKCHVSNGIGSPLTKTVVIKVIDYVITVQTSKIMYQVL